MALLSDCRKTYITKRVVRPTPINPQKVATCAWLFALLKGGAPRWSGGRTAILSLVRCPDGHTFFAFLRTTGPARERSMGAEALRQPLAKTRKSGLSHFFDTLRGEGFPSDCYDRSRLLKISAPIKEKTTAAAMPPAVAVRPPVKTPRNPRWAIASFTPSAMV